jgi:aspartyl-tRNA(Asn)/glutamyl-tRNA(Gln) amidotransferase subunit A
MTILEAADALRRKKVSSLELTAESLNRIATLNPKLNAFLAVLEEEAWLSATQADRELAGGFNRGPLHGVPVAVKDVFHMNGVRTTGGSKLFADFIPNYDAAVVERLRQAGAVIVGKTNMHELAFGITSNNPHFGAVHNPWDLERIPGGSSGGSASAVSGQLVFMATGNDTGGSVRIPASYCGIVGIKPTFGRISRYGILLKPTFGRISRYGILPLDFSLDHAGILTRTVREAAVTLNILAGYDPRDDSSSEVAVEDYSVPSEVSIHHLRIGWPQNQNSRGIDSQVAECLQSMAKTAEGLGAEVLPVTLPDYGPINDVHRVILHSEVSALIEPHLSKRDMFSSELLGLLQQGCLLSAPDYVNAQRLRRMLAHEWSGIFDQVECLITPTVPIPAPKIGETNVVIGNETFDVRLATTSLVRVANLLGLPAVSIVSGFNTQGLPLGVQITGAPFKEKLVLRVAAALEDAAGFHKRFPPIVTCTERDKSEQPLGPIGRGH